MTHTPVLLNEVIRLLNPQPGEFFIDGTIDGGGHSAEILKRILPGGKLLGVDRDESAILRLKSEFKSYKPNLILTAGNYADLPEILGRKKLPRADGLLLDLGFSSEQLTSGRGFSFSVDEPLLMTYSRATRPLRERLPELSEKQLADIIYSFGGERYARRIAKAIKEAERKKRIRTSGELAAIVRGAVPKNYERGRINPATRTFQALRIWVNDELGNLKKVLGELREILRPGGRVAVISFHSLEDRAVKEAFRRGVKEGWLTLLTKKPVFPEEEEIKRNPRSRSAKLRVGRMV
jgi:16S rRNA (cytosine1402-N4)-methyltransferase